MAPLLQLMQTIITLIIRDFIVKNTRKKNCCNFFPMLLLAVMTFHFKLDFSKLLDSWSLSTDPSPTQVVILKFP